MPAVSNRQARTARMALAYKEGKLPLHQVPMGARNAVKSMAQMVPGKLREFTRRDKRGYTLLGG